MNLINDPTQFHVKPFPLGWSTDDLKTLYRLRVEQGERTGNIANAMGRSDLAVRLKLSRLGWVTPNKRSRA
jgi:hypothetical protein